LRKERENILKNDFIILVTALQRHTIHTHVHM